ncbi:MAG: glycine/betaine/sarcosine/D-proline family reductase selenoprotein B [Anaerolineae bacterium]|jgi:hypothetical protein|nr:glycine/betaine/sarcosine/D-proline family reductase selenoprotein B [Anaerolineae bacterium]
MDILENREAWYDHFRQNWLAHYEATGETNFKIYQHPKNEYAPSGKGVDLSKSKLILITSAGGYLKSSQIPFDAPNPLGDYSLRTFPFNTPFTEIDFAHDHYDHTAVNADPQVLLPLRHLEDLVTEGVIGGLHHTVISYSGYLPISARTVDELFPQVLKLVNESGAQAALLVPS